MIDSDGKVINPFRCINCDELQDIFDTPCTKCGQDKRLKTSLNNGFTKDDFDFDHGIMSIHCDDFEDSQRKMKQILDNQEKAKKWDKFISHLEYEHGWFYFKNEVNESVHISITLSEKKQYAYSYGLPFRLGETNKDTVKEYAIKADQCGLKLDSLVENPLGNELQKSIEKIEKMKDFFCKQSMDYEQKNHKLEIENKKIKKELSKRTDEVIELTSENLRLKK